MKLTRAGVVSKIVVYVCFAVAVVCAAVFGLFALDRGGGADAATSDAPVVSADNIVSKGGVYGDLAGKVDFTAPATVESNWSVSKFELSKDDVCLTESADKSTTRLPIADYSYYVNEHMPAGRYLLILRTTLGTSSAVYTYTFEIRKAKMSADLISYCNDLFSKFEIECTRQSVSIKPLLEKRKPKYATKLGLGVVHKPLVAGADTSTENGSGDPEEEDADKPKESKLVVPEEAGYWYANKEKYFTPRELKFTKDIDSNVFEDDLYSFGSNNIIYNHYYQITESNFEPLFETKREFTVVPYEVITMTGIEYVEIKNVGKAWCMFEDDFPVWLGKKIASLPTSLEAKDPDNFTFSSDKYHIARSNKTWNYDTCDRYYSVRLTFDEPDFYRWNTTVTENGETVRSCTSREQNYFDVYFKLKPAQNTWRTNEEPAIRDAVAGADGVFSFDYKSVNSNNIYSGVPTYGIVGEIRYSVTETAYTSENLPAANSADWKTAEQVISEINALSANVEKTYFLTVYSKGSAEYNFLSEVLKFRIAPRENSWLVEPVMPDFSYSSAIGGITARALYESDGSTAATLKVTLGDSVYELSGDNSLWTNADFLQTLASLPASDTPYTANYELVLGGNYVPREGSMTFTVSKAVNSWLEMPSITQWTYGDDTTIKIFASPEFTAANGVMKAKLNGRATSYTLSLVRSEDGDYYANSDLTSALRALYAGIKQTLELTYSLDNFEDLPRTVNFYIEKAHNDWTATPTVNGWTWNSYTDGVYLYAEPQLCADNGSIKVAFGDKEKVFAVDKTAHRYSLADFKSELQNLGAGTHTLSVEYFEPTENSNYGGIASTVGFNVWKASNSWVKAPAVSSWQYGDVTAANIIFADSTYGTVISYAIETADGTKGFSTGGDVNAFVQSLKTLSVGPYTMKASVAGTDDYYSLSYSVEFEVTQKIKAWEQAWTDGEGNTVEKYVPTIADMEYGSSHGIAAPPTGVNATVKYFDGDNELSAPPVNNGHYRAVVTVSLDDNVNYAPHTYTFEYEITPKRNGWKVEPDALISLRLAELGEDLPDLELSFGGNDVEHYDYVITYTVTKIGGSARSANDGTRTGVIEYINANGAGTYSVNVTAVSRTGNGGRAVASFSVVADKNLNRWTASASKKELVYGTNVEGELFEPLSESGDVVYTYNGVDYGSLREFVSNGGEWQNVGTYLITVRADSLSNSWEEIYGTLSLTVTHAENEWLAPVAIEGWQYGDAANAPEATPKYGEKDDVVYSYTMLRGGVWSAVSRPVGVGEYKVYASLGATTNYKALYTENGADFEITKAQGVVDGVTVAGWQWNAFDGAVNVFSATANSAGEADYSGITFTVRRQGIADITFNGTPDSDATSALRALPEGEYTLTARTEATANYTAAENTECRFRVAQAQNVWTKTPFIVSWSVYEFTPDKNLPEGAAMYGDTEFVIKNSRGDTVYRAVYINSEQRLEQDTTHGYNLFNEPDGDYTLFATVNETNNYSGLTQSFPFIVFSGSTTRPVNYWKEIPQLQDWIAEFGAPSVPQGKPDRWSKLTYTYFAAKRENNSYIADGEALASYSIDANNAVSGQTGEIPAAPGYYVLRISSVFDGYELDSMEHDVVFRIVKPQNEWTKAPTMQGYFACDEPERPVEGVATQNSRFTYQYRNTETGEVSDDPPTVKGRYVLIATAIAQVDGKDSLFCDPIVSEIPFTVENAVNVWVTLPTISDWSEEFEPSEPQGRAEHGTVVYEYYDEFGNRLDSKPLTAGRYKLVATVEVDGYDTLTNESEFTVTSAWDQALLWVDIALGLVGCAFAVVVIIFAIKRYKEN